MNTSGQTGTSHWTYSCIQCVDAVDKFTKKHKGHSQKQSKKNPEQLTETINRDKQQQPHKHTKGNSTNPTFPLLVGLCSPTSQIQQNSQCHCISAETTGHSSAPPVWHLHIGPVVDLDQTKDWDLKCSGH